MYYVEFRVCYITTRIQAKESVYRKANFEIKTNFVNFSKKRNGKVIGLDICGSGRSKVQLKSSNARCLNANRLTIWSFRLKTKIISACL